MIAVATLGGSLGELVAVPASVTKLKTCAACKCTFVPLHPGKGLYCYNENCVRARERARYAKICARTRLYAQIRKQKRFGAV